MKNLKPIRVVLIALIFLWSCNSHLKCDFYPQNCMIKLNDDNYHFEYVKIDSCARDIALIKLKDKTVAGNVFNLNKIDSQSVENYLYSNNHRPLILLDSIEYTLLAEAITQSGSDMHRFIINLPKGWSKMNKIRGIEVRTL